MRPNSDEPDGRGDASRDEHSIIGAPRWVKVLGVVAVVLILAFVISHLMGGGLGNHARPAPGPAVGSQPR